MAYVLKGGLIFSAGPGLDPSVFVLAHALFCKGAPVEACRADNTGIHFTAGFTFCFGLVAPNLDTRAAETTFYIFGFGLFYVLTAGAFALEHDHLACFYLYYYIERYMYMILLISEVIKTGGPASKYLLQHCVLVLYA